jgi:serine protease
MKKYRNSSFILILLMLAACGGNTDPNVPIPGTLIGTLTAPIGGSVQGSLLLACFLQANICNINSENTEILEVTSNGSNSTFRLNSLAEGSYILLAFKDTNKDGDLRDIADYQGCYGTGNPCTPIPISPPDNDLNIQLQTELPPVIPGSISGTLSMPGQAGGTGLLDNQLHPVRTTPSQPNFRAGEVIVKFKSNGISTLATYEPLASYQFTGHSLQRVRLLGLKETALYKSNLSLEDTLALVADLNARSDVEYAQPNYLKYALKIPNDEFYGVQWHYRAMNLEKAWDIEDGTTNPVTVAVVDTGLLPHPDLQGVNIGGYDFVSDTANSGDGDGRDANPTDLGGKTGYHGGHVAGTIAARTNNTSGLAGVSWGAKVVPVRVLGSGGGTIADIIDGALWAGGVSVVGAPANPNPARVINLSLGGEGPCSALEEEAFQTLKNKGVIVVVAAGNDNDDAGFFSPANCNNVITVGATGPTGARAPYSNYGSKIDVMATGGDTSQTIDFNGKPVPAGVWSTLKDDETDNFIYAAYQGTSMAAPHIAGIVALMLSKEPSLTPDQVLARLIDSAKALSASQCQRPSGNDCGAGLVDAAAALGSSSTEPPPAPPTEDVKTYAVAFYCANTFCNDFIDELSVLLELTDTRQQIPYQITDLVDGAYAVGAFQDLDGNIDLSIGEPFGAYENLVFIENKEGQGGIDILLEPYTASGAAITQRMMASLKKTSLNPVTQKISRPVYLELSALEALLK